ncbi:uncharacterized protein LOC124404207 [Diprion similis]|uniref:uncharacterized protein LOC124404207 n=1 Tax=Diprion similis TaxID=362088 RepID=UPI001EF87707|nr:uncharacterized protein LOC124404207 [Diprion similis]XP_046734111.1 uncharacterized protein LOC124404207 [Diprion similis]XP_046734112.1 uncharacterized protein LOC124404207 [Diprion similis]
MGFVSIFLFTVMAFVNLPGINSKKEPCPSTMCRYDGDCNNYRVGYECSSKRFACCLDPTPESRQVAACTDQGGTCMFMDECTETHNARTALFDLCPEEGDVCCMVDA